MSPFFSYHFQVANIEEVLTPSCAITSWVIHGALVDSLLFLIFAKFISYGSPALRGDDVKTVNWFETDTLNPTPVLAGEDRGSLDGGFTELFMMFSVVVSHGPQGCIPINEVLIFLIHR